MHSCPLEPAENHRDLSSLKIALLKTCNEILAYAEEKFAFSGLLMSFAKKRETTQLNGLVTIHGFCRMTEKTDVYAVDSVIPFLASFNDRSPGFEASCKLTRVIVQCIDNKSKMLVNVRRAHGVERCA